MAEAHPVRQRTAPNMVNNNALLGALMLGLRRLEVTRRAPALDLAVLEETLGYYEDRLRAVPVWVCWGARLGPDATAFMDNGLSSSVQAETSTRLYYLEIDDIERGMPRPIDCKPWNFRAGFTRANGSDRVHMELPAWRTAAARSLWRVEWDPAAATITVELVGKNATLDDGSGYAATNQSFETLRDYHPSATACMVRCSPHLHVRMYVPC